MTQPLRIALAAAGTTMQPSLEFGTMSKRLRAAIANRRRIRRSVEHLESHLLQRPDAWPTVGELAAAAALSPYHFIRLYQIATGETPVVTARRLKLQAARTRLLTQPRASVLDVALSCGYENAQAFTRAFRREFGCVPSGRQQHAREAAPAAASWIVKLPPLGMQSLSIERDSRDAGLTFDEVMGSLDVARVPRYQQDMFCVISADLHLSQACVLDNPGIPLLGAGAPAVWGWAAPVHKRPAAGRLAPLARPTGDGGEARRCPGAPALLERSRLSRAVGAAHRALCPLAVHGACRRPGARLLLNLAIPAPRRRSRPGMVPV